MNIKEARILVRIAIAWARYARRHPEDAVALSSSIEAMDRALAALAEPR